MAGLFQQLHLLLNVSGRFGATAAGAVVTSAGIGWRWWEERRAGHYEVMLMVRMSVSMMVMLRLRWLVNRMMAASCGGQTHPDGEGSAHVHHFADHGQSGRFLQFKNRFLKCFLFLKNNIRVVQPIICFHSNYAGLNINGGNGWKYDGNRSGILCQNLNLNIELRRRDGWLLRDVQEICWVKKG